MQRGAGGLRDEVDKVTCEIPHISVYVINISALRLPRPDVKPSVEFQKATRSTQCGRLFRHCIFDCVFDQSP